MSSIRVLVDIRFEPAIKYCADQQTLPGCRGRPRHHSVRRQTLDDEAPEPVRGQLLGNLHLQVGGHRSMIEIFLGRSRRPPYDRNGRNRLTPTHNW